MKDPYVYNGTNVLVNKLNLTNQKDLDEAEADDTSLRLKELIDNPLPGKFDRAHLYKYHGYIFQDLFWWAGVKRTIDIEKREPALGNLSVEYSCYNNIDSDLDNLLDIINQIDWKNLNVDNKAIKFSEIISRVWKVHPFREGNTRTIVTFFYAFLVEKNIDFNIEIISDNSQYFRTALAAAIGIDDKYNKSYLERIILDSMSDTKGEY